MKKEITLQNILEIRKIEPRRRCFATHSGIQDKKQNGTKTFSVPFEETIRPIYEAITNFKLKHNPSFGNYWHWINSDDELNRVKEWETSQGERVFLRDCLSLSLALGINLENNTSGKHTEIGQLEYQAKNHQNKEAVEELGRRCIATIEELPFYRDADLIAAVPQKPDKTFDLPTEMAKIISTHTGKSDITSYFSFGNLKGSVKEAPLERKWAEWENANLSLDTTKIDDLKGKKVILIDDKYQSGTTIQFVAMVLQKSGVSEIYGLCLVKTLRDTDNR
jgi:predicted amidophosphoribosyltransferase